MDKQKIITSAQKYQQKGQFKKAIKEYQKILKEDSSDIRTRLKIADLYHRLGKRDEAIRTFKEVANFYQQQGFIFKAVAVYKQIIKLCPEDIEVYLNLAGLYQQLGLIADAISQFRIAIEICEKKNDDLQKLYLIRRMLELDPENIKARVKLAEDFSVMGLIQDAVVEFRTICKILKEKNAYSDYINVAERLLYHKPDDFEICKDLASHYIENKDGLKALSKLQICYKINHNDPEILELLGKTFEFLAQPQKAVTIYKELAKIYEKSGLINERNDIYKKVIQLNPDEPSAKEALHLSELVGEHIDIEFETVGDIELIEPEEIEEEITVEKAEDTDVVPFQSIADEEIEEVKISEESSSEVEIDKEFKESFEELEFYISNQLIEEAKALLEELEKKYPYRIAVKEKAEKLREIEKLANDN